MRTIVKNEELLDLAEKKTGMYMVDRQLSSLLGRGAAGGYPSRL